MANFKPLNFGKYILLDKIAMGGMAEVYRAKAPGAEGIGKIIALKRILPQFTSNTDFIEMFKSEANIAINLTQANIAQIYEFGEIDENFYLAMEFIDGRNLRQILSRCAKLQKSLTIEQCVFVMAQVSNGLDYAHRCVNKNTGASLNIIHRDMSPQNVMLSFEGEIKIVDFGIAKAESKIENTRAGTLKGKFGYMSPEQAEGLELDTRTDIFSTGIILWELLSGERLFIANNEVNTIRKIRECQIPSLKKINPNIHDELERITMKALAKDRSLRYQTATEMYRDLSRFLYRINPEFTPHDLSIFIKGLFKEEILEDRRKLQEYAKVTVAEVKHDAPQKEETTQIIEEATGISDELKNIPKRPESKQMDPPQNLAPESSIPDKEVSLTLKLDPSDITKKTIPRPQAPPPLAPPPRNYQKPTMITRTTTGSFTKKKSFFGLDAGALMVLGIIGGLGYFTLTSGGKKIIDEFAKLPSVDGTPTPAPTVSQAKIYISSVPFGAQIKVDGLVIQNTTTPAEISVPMNKKIKVTLLREGYIDYEKEVVASDNVQEILATLQRSNYGYLNINVSPNTSNVVVYINNQRLEEKPPIKRYAVNGGENLTIRAVDPYTNRQSQKQVKVPKDHEKSIDLYLEKSNK